MGGAVTDRRYLPRSDTYIDGTPVAGRIYQEDSTGKLVPVTLAGGSEVIPTGYTITRAASGLWVASESSGDGGGSGTGTGTPGDLSVPLYHGAPLIIDAANLTSGTSEQPEHKENARKGHNFVNVGALRLQGVIIQAVPSGKLAFQVSLNSGGVWQFPNAASSGPFLSVAATGYPVIGDWFPVDAGVQVNNIIWRLVCVMPGGVVVPLEHGVIWLDMTSFATPPVTESPTDPDLPSDGGTTWGDPILDLNANTLSALGILNGQRAIPWDDTSASNFDAVTVPSGVGSVRSGGEYHDSGWNGGPYPYVQVKPNDYGWRCGISGGYAGHTTYYYLLDDISGAGVGNVAGNEAANISASDEGSGANHWLRIQSDGKLFVIAGANIFGSSSITSTIAVNDGLPHMVRLVHQNSGGAMWLFIDGVLDGNVGGATGLVQPWQGFQYFGAGTDQTNKGTYKVHQIVRYNKDHPVAGINVIEAAMLARAGM